MEEPSRTVKALIDYNVPTKIPVANYRSCESDQEYSDDDIDTDWYSELYFNTVASLICGHMCDSHEEESYMSYPG
jgi:hypothetical protein